jgi:hypothetical protein
MFSLFISYRRADSEGFAGWLSDLLRSPSDGAEPDEVFLDVDDIAPGANFERDMITAVGQSDAVLVVMGRHWVRPALQNSNDPVRLEIEAAITGKVPIYCVTVDEAEVPDRKSLPSSLRALSSAPRAVLNEGTFADDVRRLRSRLVAEVRPKLQGRIGRAARLEVVHANPGFWSEGSSFRVVLDDKSLGTVMANTPLHSFDIAPGRHRLQCRRGLRKSEVVQFELQAGSQARVEVRLALTGGLECRLVDRP